jgi:hypothetical protein
MDIGLCNVPMRPLLANSQRSSIKHKFSWLHFSSLANIVVVLQRMKHEVKVAVFQAMIYWTLQLTLQWLLIHTCLAKKQCLKPIFSITLWVNAYSNVFSKSAGPGYIMHPWKTQFVWGGFQITADRRCRYAERWCSLHLVSLNIHQT